MNRREFNKSLGVLSLGTLSGLFSCKTRTGEKDPVFLIVSGWQTVNIGDIAHTPGLLALIDEFFPDAGYYLWPRDIEDHGVEEMLLRHFPKLKVIKTNMPGDWEIRETDELKSVFEKCDILLHGSGPHVLEQNKIRLWVERTGKPYGVCGVTEQRIYPEIRETIENSAFFFTRETASLKIVKDNTDEPDYTGFFPDATFGLNIHNEENALSILRDFDLNEKEFICIVPRLRFTPYHKIHEYIRWDQEKIDEVNSVNDRFKEIDHAKLRTVIINWVRETGKKVLLCPEMSYQLEIMDELLLDSLPAGIRAMVYKIPEYWITDTAASVYKRAFAVISMECHSPIISIANNTPAFYVRQKEDTIKGQMYNDIGLSDWVFEIDEVDGELIYAELNKLLDDYPAGQGEIAGAYEIINRRYRESFNTIEKVMISQ